jgi:SAM-dependent methyltransferase
MAARSGRSAVHRGGRHRREAPQVDAFLRALAATLPADPATLPSPLRVVDLGCGNAYLTFAAYRYLADLGVKVQVVGVDVREDQRARNTALAAELGCADAVSFVAGTIEDAVVDAEPDLVLALHACDTATDQALARAIGWAASWVLAAPCCHHDIAAQLKGRPAPVPYGEIDPARHPAGTVRRRADRRVPGRVAAAERATGSTSWSSWTPPTRRVICCSGRGAPAARTRARERSTRR